MIVTFTCNHAALWTVLFLCLSICPSYYVTLSYDLDILRSNFETAASHFWDGGFT